MRRYNAWEITEEAGGQLVYWRDVVSMIDGTEAARLRAALRELFAEMSLPMHDDPRYRDVTVQIDRETYERVKALLDGEA